MKCSRIRKMISPYVDDELSQDDKRVFTAHIEQCAVCKEELEHTRSVHEMFAFAEDYSAPPGFTTRVMANLEQTEEPAYSPLWHILSGQPLFLRTAEVAFAVVVMLVGIISGNLLVSDRITVRQPTIQESFSLDLFQATPPGSIGGVYARLAGGDQ